MIIKNTFNYQFCSSRKIQNTYQKTTRRGRRMCGKPKVYKGIEKYQIAA